MKRALPLLLLLTLTSCGKFFDNFSRLSKSNGTLVKFDSRSKGSRSMRTGPSIFPIVVYAAGTDNTIRTLYVNASTDSFSLPNGTYNFFAVGWPSGGFTTQPRCGTNEGPPKALQGTPEGGSPTSIDINMSTEACVETETVPGSFFQDAAFLIGSTMKTPALVFCDEQTDFSTISSASPGNAGCQNSRQSPAFKAPGAVGSMGSVLEIRFSSSENRWIYLASPYTGGSMELFSSDINGLDTIRQNNHMHFAENSSHTVSEYQIVPGDDSYAIYKSDEEYDVANSGVFQLYLTQIGEQGGERISPTLDNTNGNHVSGDGVQAFKISNDGKYVVMAVNVLHNGPIELYAVDISGETIGPPVKISHHNITATAVGLLFGSGPGGGWEFQISGDKRHVVYSGEFENLGKAELFITDIDAKVANENSDTSISYIGNDRVNTPFTPSNYTVENLRLNRNGTKITWTANSNQDAVAGNVKIYGTDLSTPTTPASLAPHLLSRDFTGLLNPSSNVFAPWMSFNSDKIAFSMDPHTSGTYELWITDFSSLSAPTSTEVNVAPSGEGFSFVTFTDNDHYVVYERGTSSSTESLYASDITTGSPNEVNLTPNMLTGVQQNPHGRPFILLDNNRVQYLADDSTAPGVAYRLRESWIVGAPKSVDISGGSTADKVASSFDARNGFTMFTMDDPSTVIPYFIDVSAGNPPVSNARNAIFLGNPADTNGWNYIHSASSLNIPPQEFSNFLGFDNPALIVGVSNSGASTEDVYLSKDVTAAVAPIHLTHNDGGTYGHGRYQYSIMAYEFTAGVFHDHGDLISSDCMSPSMNTDGTPNSDNFKIPFGQIGGFNPFAVRVRVFPNALDCTDTANAKDYIFPHGLANPSEGEDAPYLKLLNDSSVPTFLIKD